MKRTASVTLLATCLIVMVAAATEIPPGPVFGDWHSSGNPYNVHGEIYVPYDSTLSIHPGVEVVFQGHYKFIVRGFLEALGAESDSIRFTAADTTNGWHGLRFIAAQDSSHLSYCIIEYGRAFSSAYPDYCGGGIFCDSSNIVLRHCAIRNNATRLHWGRGGGMECHNYSNPTIDHCIFANNYSGGCGGGIAGEYFEEQDQLTIRSGAHISNSIIGNNESEFGGGVYCARSLVNCTIHGNSADFYGGGIIMNTGLVSNCSITGNSAGSQGGGVYGEWCTTSFQNCDISGNSSGGEGGGGFYAEYGYSTSLFQNCTITSNSTTGDGGGLHMGTSTPQVTNCVISRNTAVDGGGIYFQGAYSGYAVVTNAIVEGNNGNGGIFIGDSATFVTMFSDFCNNQGGAFAGEVPSNLGQLTMVNYNGDSCDVFCNIFEDPLFVDPANGDFHLQSLSNPNCGGPGDSPCIDAGHPFRFDSYIACSWGLGTDRSDISAYGGDVYETPGIIHVPGDFQYIQLAIDASLDGDTVLVQPGTYCEELSLAGHNIVLASLFLTTGDTSYISSTILQSPVFGSAVAFCDNDSTATLIGFTIRDCHYSWGGGIYCYGSNPNITNNILIGNIASSRGGGIVAMLANPRISYNTFIGNLGDYGAGIHCTNASPYVLHNVFIANHASFGGGAIACHNSSFPIIVNNTFYRNSSDERGGGIYCEDEAGPTVTNAVFWDNYATLGGDQIFLEGSSSITVSYSDVQGGWIGEGNIDIDPLFRDPDNRDLHLQDSIDCGDPHYSPCIDVGNPDILDDVIDCDWGLGTTLSDMGAYGGLDSITVIHPQKQPNVPKRFYLFQNYPNPFNAATILRYSIPEAGRISLAIYNIMGQRVLTLCDGMQAAGTHRITWDAWNVSSGVYFCRMQAGSFTQIQKLVLLK
jgi:predicted outer membrane repeat protein